PYLAPPSFPTRRSSDLAKCRFPVCPIRSQGQTDRDQTFVNGELVFEERHLQIVGSKMTAKLLEAGARAFERRVRRLRIALGLAEDRKSTRLNSSHQIIS